MITIYQINDIVREKKTNKLFKVVHGGLLAGGMEDFMRGTVRQGVMAVLYHRTDDTPADVVPLMSDEIEPVNGVLVYDADDGMDQYTLPKEFRSVWLTVDNASVYVRRTDEGVAVDIYPVDKEAEEAVAACYAFNTELELDNPAEEIREARHEFVEKIIDKSDTVQALADNLRNVADHVPIDKLKELSGSDDEDPEESEKT